MEDVNSSIAILSSFKQLNISEWCWMVVLLLQSINEVIYEPIFINNFTIG